jgi:hypothetical protein
LFRNDFCLELNLRIQFYKQFTAWRLNLFEQDLREAELAWWWIWVRFHHPKFCCRWVLEEEPVYLNALQVRERRHFQPKRESFVIAFTEINWNGYGNFLFGNAPLTELDEIFCNVLTSAFFLQKTLSIVSH